LRVDELVGRLRAVADRQRRIQVEIAGTARAIDQVVDRQAAQHVSGALGVAGVALDQSTVGAADARDRLAGRKMHDRVDVHARVGLAPADDRNIQHRNNVENE